MATTNTWDQVVEKISGVVNRGAFSKTFTPTTSSQSASGAAGYYSSVSTTCNAVSLSGNAAVGNVLTGKTFYTTSLTKQTGTMANRGNLNWNPSSSTTYSVSSGYYSGGTLNSSGAYNAGVTAADNRTNTNSTNYKSGYNAGYSAGVNATKGRYVTITSATLAKQSCTYISNATKSIYCATFNPNLSSNPFACVCLFYCSNRTAKTTYISTGSYFYCSTTESGDADAVIRYTGPVNLTSTSCCIPSALSASVPTSMRAYVYY